MNARFEATLSILADLWKLNSNALWKFCSTLTDTSANPSFAHISSASAITGSTDLNFHVKSTVSSPKILY